MRAAGPPFGRALPGVRPGTPSRYREVSVNTLNLRATPDRSPASGLLRCVSPCGVRPGVRLSTRLVAARASRGPFTRLRRAAPTGAHRVACQLGSDMLSETICVLNTQCRSRHPPSIAHQRTGVAGRLAPRSCGRRASARSRVLSGFLCIHAHSSAAPLRDYRRAAFRREPPRRPFRALPFPHRPHRPAPTNRRYHHEISR